MHRNRGFHPRLLRFVPSGDIAIALILLVVQKLLGNDRFRPKKIWPKQPGEFKSPVLIKSKNITTEAQRHRELQNL